MLLTLLPLAFLVWAVVHYAIPVPFLDEWDFIPLLEKLYRGELAPSDLWAPHNEHRIPLSKYLMLALARLTGWNINYELAFSVILATGILALLLYQLRTTGKRLKIAGLQWAAPALSVLVFSLAQYQNWLWGQQFHIFLHLLVVVAGIVLLASPAFSWLRFALAALLGLAATYSFGSGIAFWPVGLLLLLWKRPVVRPRAASSLVWLGVSCLSLAPYFYHYHTPQAQSLPGLLLTLPASYLGYVLKYLGGICAQYQGAGPYALACGLGVLLATAGAAAILLRRKIADVETLLPYIGFGLYSIFGALLCGIARVRFGSEQALSSRYCTLTAPLWASLIVFLFLLVNHRTQANFRSMPQPAGIARTRGVWPSLGKGVLALSLGLLVLGSIFATTAARALSQRQAAGRAELLHLAAHPEGPIDYGALALLYPRPQTVVERYPFLLRRHLTVFHDR
ncbi:MAG TPA: hypothetical protein VN578_24115 [Candidatus Binatia bacterium]|nr:hypothetical protein [Candidatus Binatia bacterium]